MLKACLLETLTLSDHEKMDILFKSEPLGGQKPSQMLASMLVYCPSGMEQTVMCQYLFLQRMPVTLKTFLGEQQLGNIRSSNGNGIETKAERSFDLGFVFNIQAKRTCLFQNL
jgi:hypothetical protein